MDAPSRYQRWRAFHEANPGVYDLFRRFAVDALRQERRQRFGARMIWERLRWYTQVETNGSDFKLNNDFAPYFARLLMLERPDDFGDFFELRDSRFDVSLDQMKADFFGNGHFEQGELF